MDTKKIFSRKIAFDLIGLGHNLLYVIDNQSKPWLKVFCFNIDNTFLEDLTKLSGK